MLVVSLIFLISSFLFSQRVQKCLQRQGFDVVRLLTTDVASLCQVNNLIDFMWTSLFLTIAER